MIIEIRPQQIYLVTVKLEQAMHAYCLSFFLCVTSFSDNFKFKIK